MSISSQFKTPVVVIFFNRPNLLKKLFAVLEIVKPAKLYLIADGPRCQDDLELCSAARKIFEKVSWDCEVLRNYSYENLGCKNRVITGLDWVFEREDSAIILEDDCLPDYSFFEFVNILLEHYQKDTRIAAISGNNFIDIDSEHSYVFSRYTHLWGWATWRRVWQLYDREVKSWEQLMRPNYIAEIAASEAELNAIKKSISSIRSGALDTWDSQWLLTCWSNNMLTILPQKNLVANIGFGENATHTKGQPEKVYLEAYSVKFPLTHPLIIRSDLVLDRMISKKYFSPASPLKRLINKLMKLCAN
jgi:hypothetical protein